MSTTWSCKSTSLACKIYRICSLIHSSALSFLKPELISKVHSLHAWKQKVHKKFETWTIWKHLSKKGHQITFLFQAWPGTSTSTWKQKRKGSTKTCVDRASVAKMFRSKKIVWQSSLVFFASAASPTQPGTPIPPPPGRVNDQHGDEHIPHSLVNHLDFPKGLNSSSYESASGETWGKPRLKNHLEVETFDVRESLISESYFEHLNNPKKSWNPLVY